MKSRGAKHGVDRRSRFPRVLLQHLGEPFRRRRGCRQGGDPVLAELEQEHDAEKAEHRQSEDTRAAQRFRAAARGLPRLSRGRMAAGSPRLPEIAFNSNGKIGLLGSR